MAKGEREGSEQERGKSWWVSDILCRLPQSCERWRRGKPTEFYAVKKQWEGREKPDDAKGSALKWLIIAAKDIYWRESWIYTHYLWPLGKVKTGATARLTLQITTLPIRGTTWASLSLTTERTGCVTLYSSFSCKKCTFASSTGVSLLYPTSEAWMKSLWTYVPFPGVYWSKCPSLWPVNVLKLVGCGVRCYLEWPSSNQFPLQGISLMHDLTSAALKSTFYLKSWSFE